MNTDATFIAIRAVILFSGWPILILGSIYLVRVVFKFYRDVRSVIGKLVAAMVVGWLVSMYSLGITATAFMYKDVRAGVLIVLPIFFIWFVTMVILSWAVIQWSKEATTLNAFYLGLEDLVREKTKELKNVYTKQLEQERELRKLRERFVFIAAHQLRTPVTAIDWGLKTLLDDEDFRKEISQDYITLIENLREKNAALLDLVADTLNVARLQSGTIEIELESVPLKSIVQEVKNNITEAFKTSGVSIDWQIEQQIVPPVRGHALSLREVLDNLISNAIRYNKDSGHIAVRADVRDDEVRIMIQDTGIGMDPHEMNNLFTEFYRVKNQETKKIEGTGLGLFISKQLIERMGGRIWVESTKGTGSTFTFSLPRANT